MAYNPPNCLEDKCGKVFLVRHGEPTLVEGSKFSYLTFRAYDTTNGDASPLEMQDFKGKRYSLRLRLSSNEFMENCNYDTKFLGYLEMPILMGENALVDLSVLDEALELELESLKHLALSDTENYETDSPLELVHRSQANTFWAFTSPRVSILKQDLLLSSGAFLHTDDLMELKQKYSGIQSRLPYNALSSLADLLANGILSPDEDALDKITGDSEKLLTILSECCKKFDPDVTGENTNDDDIDGLMNAMALGNFAVEVSKRSKEAAIAVAKRYGISAGPSLNSFAGVLRASCLEYSHEWRTRDNVIMLPAQLHVARTTSAGYVFLEFIALQRGVHVSDNIRSDPLFQFFRDQVATFVLKFEDVFSMFKEMDDEEGLNNEAGTLHLKMGYSLDNAMRKLIDDANNCTHQVDKVGEFLKEVYQNDSQLSSYIVIAKEMIMGLVQWNGLVKRYRDAISFDCYVHDD